MSRKRKPQNVMTFATFMLDGEKVKVRGHYRGQKKRQELERLLELKRQEQS